MARRLKLSPDVNPVDESALIVYPVDDDQPVTQMSVTGIVTRAPYENLTAKREYNVEVEYKPVNLALDDESFTEYLSSFDQAKVSQELLTGKIKMDLMDALQVGDVFVEAHRTAPAHKRTRVGGVQ